MSSSSLLPPSPSPPAWFDTRYPPHYVAQQLPSNSSIVVDGALDDAAWHSVPWTTAPLVDITRAPVKSHARMLNKLESAEDHRDKPTPRPKHNVDTVRGGVVVYDAGLMRAVYDAIAARDLADCRIRDRVLQL